MGKIKRSVVVVPEPGTREKKSDDLCTIGGDQRVAEITAFSDQLEDALPSLDEDRDL